jgi:ABC-type dipeptide/oligopeptide/nickel transport system ATPase component
MTCNLSEEFPMNVKDSSAQEALASEAERLLDLSEDELNQLLEMRVNAIQQDVSLSLQPSFEVEISPFEAVRLPAWVQKTVDAMIKTALEQTHHVVCSSDPDYLPLRTQLVSALGLGGTAAVLAFAAFLTTTLGVAAALATVIATIIIKKIGEPALKTGHQTLCAEFEAALQAKYTTTGDTTGDSE